MKLVYIAGKFRGPTAWDIEQNIRRAELVGMEVARLGAAPLIPHANSRFFHGTLTDEFWLAATMAMLDRCDAVQLVPGWPSSKGTLAEMDRARERGIPVFPVGDGLASWLKETSKAEALGDVSQGPLSPLTAVRDAHETPARQEAASSAVGVPGNAGAQAGDWSQSSATSSASPSNVSKGGPGTGAEPGASRPAAAPADQPAALVPGELCDIDDLPDCLVGGVHQPHCRHAGKPVTKGGNP